MRTNIERELNKKYSTCIGKYLSEKADHTNGISRRVYLRILVERGKEMIAEGRMNKEELIKHLKEVRANLKQKSKLISSL